MPRKALLPLDRRDFLKASAATLASASIATPGFPETLATTTQAAQKETIPNRAPLAGSAFYALPLGAIRPRGWLKRQLQIQANGLGGHLDEIWADVGSNSGWLGGTGESWERGPYFVDGLLPLAYHLDDAKLKAKAQRFIEWTLTHQQANGLIGPATNDDCVKHGLEALAVAGLKCGTREQVDGVHVGSQQLIHVCLPVPY